MLIEAIVIAGLLGVLLTLIFGLKFTEDVWLFHGFLNREKKPKHTEDTVVVERKLALDRRELLATPRSRGSSRPDAFNVVYETEEGTKIAYPVPPLKTYLTAGG